MARRKRASQSIVRAETRAAALESLDPALDLGNDLTLAALKTSVEAANATLATYNTQLSELDGLLDDVRKAEAALNLMVSRMINAVSVRYGKKSIEYAQAGGSFYKSRAKKKPTTPETPPK